MSRTSSELHGRLVVRIEEGLRIVAELEEAALSAEHVLVLQVDGREALFLGRLDVYGHAADWVFVRCNGAKFGHRRALLGLDCVSGDREGRYRKGPSLVVCVWGLEAAQSERVRHDGHRGQSH